MLEHYKINTIGPLLLFQATLPLLNAATKPKFVIMSSGAASITIMNQLPFDAAPYCCSKEPLQIIWRRRFIANIRI
jgi:norsolorinic acid ketoreductase